VGTEKRERQKANRQQRLEEEARAERAGAVKRNALRWGAAGVAALGAVVLIAWVGGAFGGGDDEESVESEITLPPIDTTPVETLPTPDVEIPDTLPEDLVVTVLQPGEGPEARVGDTVTVNYVGVRSEDGVQFDNSFERGQPFPVVLGTGSVIQGWDDGLVGAQAGARIQLDIPPDLAYGDQARSDVIRANEALTFVIDVVSVTPAENS